MIVYTLQTYNFSLQALYVMEISNLTLCERGWQGNTIPMAWSTFWVHPSEQILWKPNRSV